MRTYSVKEAAVLLGLGHSTVNRLCSRQRIKATQSGPRAHYVISSVALRDFKSTLKDKPLRGGKPVRYGRPRKTHPKAKATGVTVSALSLVRALRATIQTKLDKLCAVEAALVELGED